MKKLVAMMLAAVMCAGVFAGCNSKEEGTDANQTETKSYVILEEDFGEEEYGIAFRKGDNALAMEVQKQLEAMMEDGKADEISNKWFGENILLSDADYLDPSVPENATDDSLQKIKDKGTLVLGLDASFPPMGFTDEKGNIVGFDIDLATEVAKRIGVELKVQPIIWDNKETELNNGNIDVIWNGMSITEERLAAMTFAKPYVANRQIILVPEGSDIKSKADLSGKTVGLQKGSSALDAVEADKATMDTFGSLEQYEDNVAAIQDMDIGRLDAVVLDEVVAKYIIAQRSK